MTPRKTQAHINSITWPRIKSELSKNSDLKKLRRLLVTCEDCISDLRKTAQEGWWQFYGNISNIFFYSSLTICLIAQYPIQSVELMYWIWKTIYAGNQGSILQDRYLAWWWYIWFVCFRYVDIYHNNRTKLLGHLQYPFKTSSWRLWILRCPTIKSKVFFF